MRKALEKACRNAGGQTALAQMIGTNQSTLWSWLRQTKRGVPAEFVLKIERVTGVRRYELRPDIFPRPKPRKTAGKRVRAR